MDQVAAVRKFSRFYTRRIGVLHEGLLGSPFSLAEGRVLYELGQHDTLTATALAADLGLDPGYLSRILRSFDERGLLRRRPSAADARQRLLSLSDAGRAAFEAIDARSRGEVTEMLAPLGEAARARLVAAMDTVERLLSGASPRLTLRTHRAGDFGWIVERHGALYAAEYGWTPAFEAMVARVAAEVLERFDPACERAWIGELDGERVGSAVVVRHDATTAKLRLVLVDPAARGLGLGRRLVDEALSFAAGAGYRRMTLWTNDVLVAARQLYETMGFRLVRAEPHALFGPKMMGETWERDL